MGVYIKGMKMPNNCCQCPVNMEVCKRGYKYLLEHPELYDKRADDCPLVPVPPHGRLIDADDLRQSLKDSIDECNNWADEIEGGEMYARVSQSLGTFVECSLRVKAAATIIPADKESGE